MIAGYKMAVTKRVNVQRATPGTPVWQRNYYEHIIRTEGALCAIREYISRNPARWQMDRDNVRAGEPDPVLDLQGFAKARVGGGNLGGLR